jgi:hypothetical protein
MAATMNNMPTVVIMEKQEWHEEVVQLTIWSLLCWGCIKPQKKCPLLIGFVKG